MDFPSDVMSICFNILPSIVLKCVSIQISNNFMMSSGFQSVRSDRVLSFNNLPRTHSSALGIGMFGYSATTSKDACKSFLSI